MTNINGKVIQVITSPNLKPITYTAIEPIKQGEAFYPNHAELKKVFCRILPQDFTKHQNNGKTILVNCNGGWCTLDKNDVIVN